MVIDPFAGSTVYEYVSHKWGGPTRLVPLTTSTIGVTPLRVSLLNPRRFENVILNVSTANISMGFDGSITAGNGIIIPSLGGSVALNADEDGELVTYEVWLVAAQAGLQVWTYEVIRI
jgi:hypothetical protein